MDKVRLGMIGCGFGALDLYAPFFRYLENGQIAAAMDVDAARARRFQAATGCPKVYTELAPLLDDRDIDAVMILTPTHLHAEQVELAAAAGKHVYCEKPMARAATSAQANYRHRVQSGGGFLQEDGSHPLDVCRWWMGEVEEGSARAAPW